jgi:2-dehydropantoate 2-reductase
MKIAVVGAGAMGSIFGARFHQAGHETVLVDVAQPLVDKINADGVTVIRGDDETVTRVPATTEPRTVGPVDVVVFFTKCYHTAAAAEGARALVGPDTVIASLQNGRVPARPGRRRSHVQQRSPPGARTRPAPSRAADARGVVLGRR